MEMSNKKSLEIMESLGRQNRHSEIQKKLKKLNKNMAYCEGILLKHYLEDMKLTQAYAMLNRETMAERILAHMSNDIEIVGRFTTVHNYIDTDEMMLRKGAVSAKKDERLIIPMNMRDGSLLCLGKGNPDWNYSAPHGAGRLMSRRQARDRLKMTDYKKAMAGIYTTSVTSETIDEAPSAYKDKNEIIRHIVDTVEIIKILKPVYNFKAKE
jgi:RNA-splicing ligase RtcB